MSLLIAHDIHSWACRALCNCSFSFNGAFNSNLLLLLLWLLLLLLLLRWCLHGTRVCNRGWRFVDSASNQLSSEEQMQEHTFLWDSTPDSSNILSTVIAAALHRAKMTSSSSLEVSEGGRLSPRGRITRIDTLPFASNRRFRGRCSGLGECGRRKYLK